MLGGLGVGWRWSSGFAFLRGKTAGRLGRGGPDSRMGPTIKTVHGATREARSTSFALGTV